jgi:anhydro-N-acetylmuramic acid kinase
MSELYLGLMSGTSMDGIDAVLCEFRGRHFRRVVATHSAQYAPSLRRKLLRVARERQALDPLQFCAFDQDVARAFARAARGVLGKAPAAARRIRAIGSHGQTVFHEPEAKFSLQLGDPNLIAALTGFATVADFRRKDLALGGQGAPLVPGFHHAVFASREPRCVVNIGGIANITVLPGADEKRVRGFDTGPGNALMDEWAATHGRGAFDRGGRWAATAGVDDVMLRALLSDPYFSRTPPKSTGRGSFNLGWALGRFPRLRRLPPAQVQRTLLELTAHTVAEAITAHARASRRVLVCGGGVHNTALMRRLRALLAPRPVLSTAVLGLDPAHVEGAAFAWLAMRALHGLPGNLPAVTGASAPAVLGAIYPA